jgi:hypothetical protein
MCTRMTRGVSACLWLCVYAGALFVFSGKGVCAVCAGWGCGWRGWVGAVSPRHTNANYFKQEKYTKQHQHLGTCEYDANPS